MAKAPQIADLVDKRHDTVRVSMDRLVARDLITVTSTTEPLPGGGKPVEVYHVNQLDSYVVVAQLSPEFTARLVDRWQELEAQAVPATLAGPSAPAARRVRSSRHWQDALGQRHRGAGAFEFIPGLSLRVTEIDGTPWFVAADVCKSLGLTGYASQHTSRLDADDVKVLTKSHAESTRLLALFTTRAPTVSLISEPGLYALALRANKQEAKDFQKWVRSTVLPAIRKDGAYVMGEEKVATGEMSIEAMTLRVIAALQAKVSNLQVLAEGMDPAEARVMTVPDFRDALRAFPLLYLRCGSLYLWAAASLHFPST